MQTLKKLRRHLRIIRHIYPLYPKIWDETIYDQQSCNQLNFISDINSQIPFKPLYSQNHILEFISHNFFSFNDSSDTYRARRRVQSFYEDTVTDFTIAIKRCSDDFTLKYKTEICKNFEFRGQCEWNDKVILQVLLCTWYS